MLRVTGKRDIRRGGIIASAVEEPALSDEYDITLGTGEVVVGVPLLVAPDADDWLLYLENQASDYGRDATWEVITKEDFADWLVVVGG